MTGESDNNWSAWERELVESGVVPPEHMLREIEVENDTELSPDNLTDAERNIRIENLRNLLKRYEDDTTKPVDPK